MKPLRCAFLLLTIFASLAHAHERVRVQNVRDFPQTKLDGEIDAPFLLNEHCDPQFFNLSIRPFSGEGQGREDGKKGLTQTSLLDRVVHPDSGRCADWIIYNAP